MRTTETYDLQQIKSLGRLPLSEQVYLTLRQAILTGTLEADQKLNEVKIAEQLNVSATPVREAFRKLAKDNLVIIRPWRGVTVKGYTLEELESMYQCRAVMSGLGARLCAERATEEELEELKEVIETWQHIDNSEDFVATNTHFHELIAAFSKNERVSEYLADFKEMVNRDMYTSSKSLDRMASCNDEHVLILESIINRRPEEAEERMRDHILKAFQHKKAQLEKAQAAKDNAE